MDFFKNMSVGLDEENKDLTAEGGVLHDRMRVHRRAEKFQRSKSSSRLAMSGPGDKLHGAREAFAKSSSCAALPPMMPSRPGRREWEMHDEAWERFQDDPPDPLFVEAVPWPPCVDDVLEFYEVQTQGDRKKAYRLACRRWHPDKFLQKYGAVVPPKELTYMTFRVNEVFQAVTSQWVRAKW